MFQFLFTHRDTFEEQVKRYTNFYQSEGKRVFYLEDLAVEQFPKDFKPLFDLPVLNYSKPVIFILCDDTLHLYLDARVSMSNINKRNIYIINNLLKQGVDFLIITEAEKKFDKRLRALTKDLACYTNY